MSKPENKRSSVPALEKGNHFSFKERDRKDGTRLVSDQRGVSVKVLKRGRSKAVVLWRNQSLAIRFDFRSTNYLKRGKRVAGRLRHKVRRHLKRKDSHSVDFW